LLHQYYKNMEYSSTILSYLPYYYYKNLTNPLLLLCFFYTFIQTLQYLSILFFCRCFWKIHKHCESRLYYCDLRLDLLSHKFYVSLHRLEFSMLHLFFKNSLWLKGYLSFCLDALLEPAFYITFLFLMNCFLYSHLEECIS